MGRLAKNVVEEREAEALAAFKAGGSVKDVNEALALKHGSRMGLKRMYELRSAATGVPVKTRAKKVVEEPVVE
jgi:hypothetical protein